MKLSGAEIIIRYLEYQGITIVSGIPGGANLPLYDALHKSSIRHVLVRHEQAAGFIAQGMARSTGKPAVCFATSGPGATNLVTAIADAKLDSVPIVAITGQVPTSMIGTDAFQEIDTYGMTLPISKHNFLVRRASELLSILPEAFTIATSGRQGPVVVDVPKDVQVEEIELDCLPADDISDAPEPLDPRLVQRAAEMIHNAKRPVFYVGGGVIAADAHCPLRELAEKNNIPVALTLNGLGAFPPSHPLYLGMLGMHAAPFTNMLLDEADLLLAFGVRFDDRAVGRAAEFCPRASIIHVDIDEAEINKVKRAHLSIGGDVKEVLESLVHLVAPDTRPAWLARVTELKRMFPLVLPDPDDRFHPVNVVRAIAAAAPDDAIVTTDVGQHQMWVAQAYSVRAPRTLLTSAGLGTMGFGLPAAIGAALAHPGRRVICVSGDGSIQMNIQELATLAELHLPITIVIMNNGHLGLVRQQQELFYDGNYIASKFARRLDFAAIAREFGVKAEKLADGGSFGDALAAALVYDGPYLIDVPIHDAENVLPMVPPGAATRDMIGVEREMESTTRQYNLGGQPTA
jgi:acetolactate synthase I/II/III large subunit